LKWFLEEKGCSPSSIYTYGGDLRRFVGGLNCTFVEATAADMQSFVSHGDAKPATRVRRRAALRALWKWMYANGMVDSDPTNLLVVPRLRNVNPSPVPDATWKRLWAYEHPRPAVVVLGLGYFCGLRRHEIVGLRTDHVDLDRQRLVGFKRKGGGDDVFDYGELVGVIADRLPALLPDPDRFLNALRQQAEGREGLLLSWGEGRTSTHRTRARYGLAEADIDPGQVNERLRRWQRSAGVTAFSPHKLRHSFVTNLLRAGVPLHIVSRMANHTNVTTTMRYVKAGGQELAAWRSSVK